MRTFRLSLALLMIFFGSASSLRAEKVEKFDKMLSNMGFELTPETDSAESSFVDGSQLIYYGYSGDKSNATLSIGYLVSDDKLKKVPALEMLNANGQMTSMFEMRGKTIFLSRSLPLEGLTAIKLRHEIDSLKTDANDNKALLDVDSWK